VLTRWAKLYRAYGAECAVVGVREENLQTEIYHDFGDQVLWGGLAVVG
jgi:hypothetical protein